MAMKVRKGVKMKLRLPWKNRKKESKEPLESLLQKTLVPVSLNPEFKKNLRERLIGETEPTIIGIPQSTFQTFVVLIGILASGIIIVFTGVRTVIAILGSLGLLQQFRLFRRKGSSSPPRLAS
jgi:hypothetical protein